MAIDSIDRVSDTVVGSIAPPPAEEEPSKEPESRPPETSEDSGKTLDLYA
jgi:hypothetical protein